MVDNGSIAQRLQPEELNRLFPADRADQFFEALLGDAQEGAYDIRLVLKGIVDNRLEMEFQLPQRPGKCLRCSLTHGLPQVFTRHPVIGIDALVTGISESLNGLAHCIRWELGHTRELSRNLHSVPLTIFLDDST